jgi:DNA-binding XRE family transcriptional regulator
MENMRKPKREIFRYLTSRSRSHGVDALRQLRQAQNITLTTAANRLGVWPITISDVERGVHRNEDLATYRQWPSIGLTPIGASHIAFRVVREALIEVCPGDCALAPLSPGRASP